MLKVMQCRKSANWWQRFSLHSLELIFQSTRLLYMFKPLVYLSIAIPKQYLIHKNLLFAFIWAIWTFASPFVNNLFVYINLPLASIQNKYALIFISLSHSLQILSVAKTLQWKIGDEFRISSHFEFEHCSRNCILSSRCEKNL